MAKCFRTLQQQQPNLALGSKFGIFEGQQKSHGHFREYKMMYLVFRCEGGWTNLASGRRVPGLCVKKTRFFKLELEPGETETPTMMAVVVTLPCLSYFLTAPR